MDSYGHCPIKVHARGAIENNARVVPLTQRKQYWAVYFAGCNSKESELLDRLGSQRELRVILEHRKDRLWKVRRANPDIRVVPVSSHEFFDGKWRDYGQFWYCGLDYECKMNTGVVRDLELIARQECLIDGGILYTNVVGTRENAELKEMYAGHLFRRGKDSYFYRKYFNAEFRRALGLIDTHGNSDGKTNADAIHVMLKSLSSEKLGLLRNLAISSSITDALLLMPRRLIFYEPYCPRSEHIIAPASTQYACAEEPLITPDGEYIRIVFDSLTLDTLFANMRENNMAMAKSRHLRELAEKVERHALSYYKKGELDSLATLFQLSESTGYVPNKMNSFSYISNRNTLMMLDVLQVRKCKQAVREVLAHLKARNIRILYGNDRLYLAEENVRSGGSQDTVQKMLWDVRRESTRHLHWLQETAPYLEYLNFTTINKQHYKRINLGSGHRPALTLEQARRYFVEGWAEGLSNDEIKRRITEKFMVSKYGWRSIAALLANKTTGRMLPPKQRR